MRTWAIIFTLSAVTGFTLGQLSNSEAVANLVSAKFQFTSTETHGATELSSYNGKADTASLYTCPTNNEFSQFTKSINFQGQFAHTCSDLKMSKFGRVLKFISSAKANIPASWTPSRDVLENPLQYLQRNSRTLQVDFNQRTTIAYNQFRGDIFLGGRFFTNDILDSAITLLHEARHSEDSDPGHANCRWGDLAGASGGCDARFDINENSGAYAKAVHIGVAWAKYHPDLSTGQREYLLSVALTRLATRFNIVPHVLAVPVEQIFVLDESGAIFPVSATSGRLQSALESQTPFKRIEFYNSNNGFVALNGTSAYVYKPNGSLAGGFFNTRNLAAQPVRDINSMSNARGEQQDSFQYILTPDNRLKFVDTDKSTGERFVNDSDYQPQNFGFTLMRLSHARRKRYALTDKRSVVMLDDEQIKIKESTFTDPVGFRQLEGGLFYVTLLGVNSEGKIKFWNEKTSSAVEATTQFSAPVRKLAYSVSFAAALLDGNKVELKFWNGKNKVLGLNHPKRIVDFVVARSYQMNHSIFGAAQLEASLTEAANACNLVKSYSGIWSGDIVGVTRSGQVQTYSQRLKKCSIVDLSKFGLENAGYVSVELTGQSAQTNGQSSSDSANLSFPTVVLKKSDGSSVSFQPYNFR